MERIIKNLVLITLIILAGFSLGQGEPDPDMWKPMDERAIDQFIEYYDQYTLNSLNDTTFQGFMNYLKNRKMDNKCGGQYSFGKIDEMAVGDYSVAFSKDNVVKGDDSILRLIRPPYMCSCTGVRSQQKHSDGKWYCTSCGKRTIGYGEKFINK